MFLLSKVYTPKEFSFRVGLLLTMATLSGLLSGPLTFAMSYFDGKNNMHDWQYLFIFEGVPTILLSVVSYFFLFDDLQKVEWLTVEQKLLQANRMHYHLQDSVREDGSDDPITLNTMKVVIFDWKTWAFAIVFFLNNINLVSMTVFSPTLIDGNLLYTKNRPNTYFITHKSGFGFPTLTSQLLTAPPCAVATIGVLTGGYLTSKYNKRSPLLAGGSIIIAIGYLCLLTLTNKWGNIE